MPAHYFIAITLPPALKDCLSAWQAELRGELPYKQWTDKCDLHITLKFLGAVEQDDLSRLQMAMRRIQTYRAFSLKIGTAGTFGHPQKPRVLWAGVEKTNTLASLQREIEAIATEIGFAKEKRVYHPHITVAKKWAGAATENLQAALQPRFIIEQLLYVNEIVIYRIHPQSSPKYEVFASYKLHEEKSGTTGDGEPF